MDFAAKILLSKRSCLAGTPKVGESIEFALIAVQFIVMTAAIVATGCVLVFFRHSRMMFFVILCIATTVHATGYFFEICAASLDAALIGCKIAHLGSPFVGPLFYLFSRDFVQKPRLAPWKYILIFGIGVVFVLGALAYPWVPAYYAGAEFVAGYDFGYLVLASGPLYYPCIIYIFLFILLALINLLRHFFKEKRYKGTLLFLVVLLLPSIVQALLVMGVFPQVWVPTSAALVVSICLMSFFLLRYRQHEWQSTGRELVVEHMCSAFILVDRQKNLRDFNKCAVTYFPSLETSRIGSNISVIENFPVEALETDGAYNFECKVGDEMLYLSATSMNVVSGGIHTGTYILIVDDTQNFKMLQELSRLARYDELTGLYNRATFFHDAAISFDLNKRQGITTGSVLMMDIDYFKTINDTYGHAVGDEVLRSIGSIMLKRFRRTDTCGRYGGEELCVWMPTTDVKGALQVAEEMRLAVEKKVFDIDGLICSVTISIGLASVKDVEPEDFDDLMKKADVALYDAKRAGRNRICVYAN